MKRMLVEVKDFAVTWGSFLMLVAAEVALIYCLFKLSGAI
jgi:hypothetical protein